MHFFLVFYCFLLGKHHYAPRNILLLSKQKEFEKGVNETMIAEFVARIKQKKWREFSLLEKEIEEY